MGKGDEKGTEGKGLQKKEKGGGKWVLRKGLGEKGSFNPIFEINRTNHRLVLPPETPFTKCATDR